MRYNRINVFFDTNKLECRFNKEKLFLDDIKLNADFQEIIDFASDNENVSFFIPEIVWREMINHLILDYKKSEQSLIDSITNFKKGFGNLFEISYTKNITNYEEYILEKSSNFLEQHKDSVSIVSHSNHEEKFKSIITNAINRKSPFATAKGNSKTYSDAGFKDMLILETIIDNCKHDEIGIIYTDDRDFNKSFVDYEDDKYFVANTINELKMFITDTSVKFIDKTIKKNFMKDDYLKESIFLELGLDKNLIIDFQVIEVSENEDAHTVNLSIKTKQDDFNVVVEYDFIANEIIHIEKEEA